jgi:hypothetical protein
MKNVLIKLDKLVCGYLGLDKVEITPHRVERKGKQLIVVNTESYKRHTQVIPISKINVDAMNNENKERLGIAIGKAIATNLIVSFEEITIKREDINA